MKKLLIVPIAAVALTLSMSACGSDSKDAAGGGSSPSSGGTITGNGGGGGSLTPQQRKSIAKVVECMRARGYDMPEPSATSPAIAPRNIEGMDPAKVNKDSRECAAKAAQ